MITNTKKLKTKGTLFPERNVAKIVIKKNINVKDKTKVFLFALIKIRKVNGKKIKNSE